MKGAVPFHRLAELELNEAIEYYEPDSIRILAVMNLKRRPSYGVGRE